jgi:amino acid adenylation domain-containing protein
VTAPVTARAASGDSPAPDRDTAGIPGLLHEVARGHDPGRVAVRFCGEPAAELTYGQLESGSSRLAHALRGAGIGPGEVVALLLERGPHLPLAQLAVLAAGAAWTPMDPGSPPARLAFQARDADARLVLTTTDLAGLAPSGTPLWCLDDPALQTRVAALPDTGPDAGVRPAAPAYLIYTSGSTGTPKGVLVSHHSARTYCHNAVRLFGIGPGDRVAQMVSPAFDVSVFEVFATLLAGATVVSLPRETVADPTAFTAALAGQQVTLSFVPPAVLAMLDPRQLASSSLRGLLVGGEALSADLANRWTRPGLDLHNVYGPTEATVTCIDYLCPATTLTAPPPIGTAYPHHHAYVLDKRLRPVPIGVPGELFITGPGIAHGYLGRPGLTAQRFLADPHADVPGKRMYATGDVARWRGDGLLEYLGRSDRQVKIRGQRVELGEIEHALATHPGVRQCAVLLRRDSYLAAYIVGDASPAALREHLAARLPTYMIPAAFATLPALPLNPNGKLDTSALPDPQPATATAAAYTAPRTPTEQWLAAAWAELLAVTAPVSATDNFFDLGANSLHGTQLIARVRDALHLHLDPRHLFTSPTLEQLATQLDQGADGEAPPGDGAIVTLQRRGTRPPLFFVHPIGGSVTPYVRLAGLLGDEQPFYAVEDPGLHGGPLASSLAERAREYIAAILKIQPAGPYHLGGWSLGGVLAFEMAAQLTQDGADVASVVAVDSVLPERGADPVAYAGLLADFVRDVCGIAGVRPPTVDPASLRGLDDEELEELALDVMEGSDLLTSGTRGEMRERIRVFAANTRAYLSHQPQRFSGRTVLIRAADTAKTTDPAPWRAVAPRLDIVTVPGNHYTMLQAPHLDALATALHDITHTERTRENRP